MKQRLVVANLMLSAAFLATAQQTPESMLGAALHQEEVQGDLKGAIAAYQKVLAAPGVSRKTAAEALVHMGQCYEKLGEGESRKVYERVVRDYSEQKEAVALARAKLDSSTTAHATGIVIRQVWAGPDKDDYVGATSPDGRLLPFTDSTTGDLALRVLATGENRRLTDKGPWSVSKEEAEWPGVISQDGKTAAYGWIGKDSFELRTIPVQGGKPRVLVHNPEIIEIEPTGWTSNGAQILAVVTRKGNNNQIALVSTSDGSVRVLKSLEWRYRKKTSLSPDDRHVVYDAQARQDSPQTDIFLLATDGSRESVLVEHRADDWGPLWTPDGRKVAFLSNRSGNIGLWMIAVADGKAQSPAELVKADLGRGVQNLGRGLQPMGISREGIYYYGFRNFRSDIHIAEWEPETAKLLRPPARLTERYVGSNLSPVWSPDGRFVAYQSSRESDDPSKRTITVVHSLESGEERDIPSGAVLPGAQAWSLLKIGTDMQGHQGLDRMEVQTGKVTRLLQFRSDQFTRSSPAVSPDGKTVYYLQRSGQRKEPALVAYDIEAGRERELASTLHSGNRASLAVSPDGRYLGILGADANESSPPDAAPAATRFLVLIPTGGGEPRELMRDSRIQEHSGLAWTPDGRFLLYTTSPARGRSELWRADVENGKREKIDLPLGQFSHVSVHPDGRRLVFSGGTGGSGNWEIFAIENLPSILKVSR